MGWLKEKYTKDYFLKRDKNGNKLKYGADGVEEWEKGGIWLVEKKILDLLNFNNAIVLDIGFGRGETIRYCLENGANFVLGVDFAIAALEIANLTLKDYQKYRYSLINDDILNFLSINNGIYRFTHIIMFDVIEHIPRSEVNKILLKLGQMLCSGGSLIIHTPFYNEDNDVLVNGLKKSCVDSSDLIEETRGMHINKYSYNSLRKQLKKFGFTQWGDNIFLNSKIKIDLYKKNFFRRYIIFKLFPYKFRRFIKKLLSFLNFKILSQFL